MRGHIRFHFSTGKRIYFNREYVRKVICGYPYIRSIKRERGIPYLKIEKVFPTYPVYMYSNVEWYKNSNYFSSSEYALETFFCKFVKEKLNRISPNHRIDLKRKYNKWIKNADKYAKKRKGFKYKLERKLIKYYEEKKENKQMALYYGYIHREIKYIIEQIGGLEELIKKNNLFIVMGTEKYLNLSDEDIEVIKKRWDENLKSAKTKLKTESTLGVNAIDLLLMLLKCKNNLSEVARKLKISRLQVKKLIEQNETMYKLYLEIEEMVLDYIEFKLMELVEKGDRNAITYLLNCKAGERGFGSWESRRRVGKTIRGADLKDDSFELD